MTDQPFLGVELPIIQAPMAGVQDSALAIAVSSAGGLGSLPCSMLSHDLLHAELTLIRSKTSQPINVNFFCHRAPSFNAKREQSGAQFCNPTSKNMRLILTTFRAALAVNHSVMQRRMYWRGLNPKL